MGHRMKRPLRRRITPMVRFKKSDETVYGIMNVEMFNNFKSGKRRWRTLERSEARQIRR